MMRGAGGVVYGGGARYATPGGPQAPPEWRHHLAMQQHQQTAQGQFARHPNMAAFSHQHHQGTKYYFDLVWLRLIIISNDNHFTCLLRETDWYQFPFDCFIKLRISSWWVSMPCIAYIHIRPHPTVDQCLMWRGNFSPQYRVHTHCRHLLCARPLVIGMTLIALL